MSPMLCDPVRDEANRFVQVALILLALAVCPSASAIPANPAPLRTTQPDGTPVVLYLRGDEHFAWTEDPEGFTVIRAKGWFEYARINSEGRLETARLRVGIDDPAAAGLERRALPTRAVRALAAKGIEGDAQPADVAALAATAATTGVVRNLVVPIQFANHGGRALPSQADLGVLFNAPGGDPLLAPTGSVRDVYLVNSYGQLQLDSDIAPWSSVSGSEQYYANGSSGDSTLWGALVEALAGLDVNVDFRQYDQDGDGWIDAITFLHSGYGAEWGGTDVDGTYYTDRIWSHRWAMSEPWVSDEGVRVADYHISPALWATAGSAIGRIGVIAHETGHFLGLPDLYDTDGGGNGIGSYGLMANSWGFDGTQRCPPHLSPWSKWQLGWIEPTDLAGPGEYSLEQSATSNDYAVITSGYASGEYLMIENRQNAGFDCALPQGGLAIWHIDDLAGFNTEGYPSRRWPRNGNHYRVALAQADGGFHLELGFNRGDAGDVHHAGGVDAISPGPDLHPNTDGYQGGDVVETGHTISQISASGPVMTFCLNGCGSGGGGEGAGGFNAPSDLVATIEQSGKGRNTTSSLVLNWTDNSGGTDNEDAFVIERCEEAGKGKNRTCPFAEHATTARDVTTFSETLGSGTYRYRVKARSASVGDSDYSNEAGA